jgi:nucleotide-binding universal stress UspA family protein
MNLSFKHILVPVDGSVQSLVAFRTAAFFAKKYSAQLTVVDISEETVKTLLQKESQEIKYQYIHKNGKVFKGIIEASKETDADLIVMGTHGITGFEEFWMGSNAYKVVSLAKCPVLTMREEIKPNAFKNIVLPIDTSFESRQKVSFAVSLAKQFGATVHVLGVSVDKDKESEHLINIYTRQIMTTLQDEGIPATLEKNLGGNITNITIDYATSTNADLIIIMTEQEPQIGSFFLGKFAQQMINHSTIPVISLMPREDLILTDARL